MPRLDHFSCDARAKIVTRFNKTIPNRRVSRNAFCGRSRKACVSPFSRWSQKTARRSPPPSRDADHSMLNGNSAKVVRTNQGFIDFE